MQKDSSSKKSNKVFKKRKVVIKNQSKILFIDLFAGTGAFSLALERNKKFNCVFTNDIVKSSKEIYELNHPNHKFTLEDLNNVDVDVIPNHDLLCGGFPCQPFSIAGEMKGFDDQRSNVFWKILKILKKHTPEMIMLENVKNLKSHDNGHTFQIIESKLKEIGYHIKTAVLDTSIITGVPHHRERIYIIGFRTKEKFDKFNFNFNIKEKRPISDFLEDDVKDKYYYTDRYKMFEKVKEGVTKHISKNVLYQWRRKYVRENKSSCCPTLTANMGSGGHNVPLLMDDNGIRKLTPRECFNLQGFPSDYKLPALSDSALYKLAGNAVSVPVVDLIVGKLNAIV